jgi:signal transduction histidine kinase
VERPDRGVDWNAVQPRSINKTFTKVAIVKQLVEAHGGRVWASSDAAGVTVGFSIPRAEDGGAAG